MKKQLPFLFSLFTLCFILVTIGCKKDKDSSKTKTELLSQGSWKFSAATLNGVDASGSIDDCQKDNTMTFVAAGTGTVDEGLTKCDPGDPQSNPFTWNFATSETILHVSDFFISGGGAEDLTLVTLSESQLVVSELIDIGGGVMQTAQVTFTH